MATFYQKISDLMKYRGQPYDPEMPLSMLLYLNELMIHDSHRNELDPYPVKYIGKPMQSVS